MGIPTLPEPAGSSRQAREWHSARMEHGTNKAEEGHLACGTKLRPLAFSGTRNNLKNNTSFTMNPKATTILSLAITMLCTGCVGTGPNTQNGAVAGGLLGAIAGGIIGNNSGSHNGASGALIGAAAGAIAGGTLGNAQDHARGTIYGSQQEATTQVQMESPPPPPPTRPREVIVERSSREAVWIPGHWEFDGRGYYWVDGFWQVPPPRYHTYVPPHWERRGSVQVYIRGYWRL